MDLLGGGHGGLWGWNFFLPDSNTSRNKRRSFEAKSSNSLQATGGSGYQFPLKQSLTAGCLTLSGDTIAQLVGRWRKEIALNSSSLEKVNFGLFDSGLEVISFLKFWNSISAVIGDSEYGVFPCVCLWLLTFSDPAPSILSVLFNSVFELEPANYLGVKL